MFRRDWCHGSRQAGEAAGPPGENVAGFNTGTEAGAPPMTFWGIQLEGHRPRCLRVRTFRACYVAGSNTATEAGAHGYKCSDAFNVAGCKQGPARPVSLPCPIMSGAYRPLGTSLLISDPSRNLLCIGSKRPLSLKAMSKSADRRLQEESVLRMRALEGIDGFNILPRKG
jgi:hypothetical protein